MIAPLTSVAGVGYINEKQPRKDPPMPHVVIIGNGISGITAARHIRKLSDNRITVISSESGHFYSRPALMYIFMGHMKYEHTKPYEDWFWEENAIDLVRGHVERVDFEAKHVVLENGEPIAFDSLIIATGSKSNKFGWPGQDLPGVQGFYGLRDLELLEENTKNIECAVLTGGGLIGVELAEMLALRGIRVVFLVREDHFWGSVLPEQEARLIGRHIASHHVDLRLQTELREILPDENGRVGAVITGGGERIPCGFVGLTAGVSPNVDFLKDSDLDVERGVMVNECFETNVPDVYAIGDCAQFRQPPPGRRPVEQVWYTGKMHGETVAKTICGDRACYTPGIWFNSAKFFDIEYQTYGMVLNQHRDGKDSFYWEHPNGEKCVRILYDRETNAVLGFNFFGIRARHTVCEKWIAEKVPLADALAHLGALNFDPEFFPGFENHMIRQYNESYPENPVRLKTRKGLFSKLMGSL